MVSGFAGPEWKEQETIWLDFLWVFDLNGIYVLLEHIESAIFVDLEEILSVAMFTEQQQ